MIEENVTTPQGETSSTEGAKKKTTTTAKKTATAKKNSTSKSDATKKATTKKIGAVAKKATTNKNASKSTTKNTTKSVVNKKSNAKKRTVAKKPVIKSRANEKIEGQTELSLATETATTKPTETGVVTKQVTTKPAITEKEPQVVTKKVTTNTKKSVPVTKKVTTAKEESKPVQKKAQEPEKEKIEDSLTEKIPTVAIIAEKTKEKDKPQEIKNTGDDVQKGKGTKSEQITKDSEEFATFDDIAERDKERAEREKRIEEDELLPPDPDAILEVRHLKKYFTLKKTIAGKVLSSLKAVDDVSFKIMPGETLGIVGESGCGKTTMGRTILKLYEPTAGQIFFKGEDIAKYKSKQMKALRTKMQIVFQDPYSSLPPRSTVGGILSEPVMVHNIVPKAERKDYVLDLMEKCGLRDYYYERYPHEFSGGQRQRICIARALAVNPEFVVCDEPVSALDVSIQAQIINLLKKLQQERKLTYLFISHDLSVVKFISDKIGVMYLGSMVEFGAKIDIFDNPLHPYTKALFSAVPNPDPEAKSERIVLKGDIPSPANPPMGCKFHTRCPQCMEICKHIDPEYREVESGHFAACHLLNKDNAEKN